MSALSGENLPTWAEGLPATWVLFLAVAMAAGITLAAVGGNVLNSSQGGSSGRDPKPGDDQPPAPPGGAKGKEK